MTAWGTVPPTPSRTPPDACSSSSYGFGRTYLHLPLVMAIIATAAGVLALLASGEAGPHERWLLAGSVAATFACVALLEGVLSTRSSDLRAERTLLQLTWVVAAGAVA